ncbi:hypothetical protein BSPWISOX_1803 [uncultured Gammaproteobacteria bacterium]|nr:hypothetical protein BSPWISOX_1803 [uncultured Gammaproteobacteria bacterium]VVM20725.1 hypothetical protein BSPWISOXPB_933 [uncultured Gammaproteobacteria bacterium]
MVDATLPITTNNPINLGLLGATLGITKRRKVMIRIQPKHGPVKAGRLMSGEELNKILLMINAKVKKGIVITKQDIEEQVLRT